MGDALLVRAQPVLQAGPVALDGLLPLVVRAGEYEGVASASNFGKVFSLAHCTDSATLSGTARISSTVASTHCSTVTAILSDTAWISSMATSPGLNIWLKMFKMKIKTTTKATILDEKQ